MSDMQRFWERDGVLVTKEEYSARIHEKITPTWAENKIPGMIEAQTILSFEKDRAIQNKSLVTAILQEDKFIDQERYREIFLSHYAKTNNLAHSAALIGVSASAVRKRRSNDTVFDRLCTQAEEYYADTVKSIFQELALNGTERTNYDRTGSVVSVERVIYPRLLELEIKRVHSTYNEKKEIAHTVAGGVLVAPSEVSVEQWSKKYNDEGNTTGLYEDRKQDMIEINPRA